VEEEEEKKKNVKFKVPHYSTVDPGAIVRLEG
jgi:hypothetical protein